jgi:hypothetical protein
MITLGWGRKPSKGPILPPTTTDVKAQAQGQTPDTGWEGACLNMTRSHDRPCLEAHITHSARHDEMGRHDRLVMPTRGASGKQSHDVEPSLAPSASRRGDISVIIYKTTKTHRARL